MTKYTFHEETVSIFTVIIVNSIYSIIQDSCHLINIYGSKASPEECSKIVLFFFVLFSLILFIFTMIVTPLYYKYLHDHGMRSTNDANAGTAITSQSPIYGATNTASKPTHKSGILNGDPASPGETISNKKVLIKDCILAVFGRMALVLYYVGDNLVPTLQEFPPTEISEKHMDDAKQASVFLLLFAGILFFIPLSENIIHGLNIIRREGSSPLLALRHHSLIVQKQIPILLFTRNLVKVDTLYSGVTVARIQKYTNGCMQTGSVYEGVAWSQWSAIVLATLVLLVVMVVLNSCFDLNSPKWRITCHQLGNCIVVAILFGSYILVNDGYPLRCVPGHQAATIARLGLWFISMIIILYVVIYLLYHCRKQGPLDHIS